MYVNTWGYTIFQFYTYTVGMINQTLFRETINLNKTNEE